MGFMWVLDSGTSTYTAGLYPLSHLPSPCCPTFLTTLQVKINDQEQASRSFFMIQRVYNTREHGKKDYSEQKLETSHKARQPHVQSS